MACFMLLHATFSYLGCPYGILQYLQTSIEDEDIGAYFCGGQRLLLKSYIRL